MTTSALSAGERDRLRSSLDGGRLGHRRTELVEHLGERLDGRHPMTEVDERPRQLARAGTEIDDVARLLAREPAHGVVGVAGTRALVDVGDAAERGCANPSLIRLGAHLSRLVILADPTPRPKRRRRLCVIDDRTRVGRRQQAGLGDVRARARPRAPARTV